MKTTKNLIIAVLLPAGFVILTAIFIAAGKPADGYKYIGVDKCAGTCHKGDAKGRQLEIWQDSKHSQAFKNLQTPTADSVAKARGFETPAAETPQCVKCHTLGKEIVDSELETTFDKTQGVQCETCHGAGSEYKRLTIMKDKELAKQNGLTIHDEGEAWCKTCHNSDSPFYKEFNYDEFWEKIKHTDPNVKH